MREDNAEEGSLLRGMRVDEAERETVLDIPVEGSISMPVNNELRVAQNMSIQNSI